MMYFDGDREVSCFFEVFRVLLFLVYQSTPPNCPNIDIPCQTPGVAMVAQSVGVSGFCCESD